MPSLPDLTLDIQQNYCNCGYNNRLCVPAEFKRRCSAKKAQENEEIPSVVTPAKTCTCSALGPAPRATGHPAGPRRQAATRLVIAGTCATGPPSSSKQHGEPKAELRLADRQGGYYFFLGLAFVLGLDLGLSFLLDLQPHLLHIFRPFTFCVGVKDTCSRQV